MSEVHPVSFVHLRCHSEYSITDGIVRIDDYIDKASSQNMPALALTDLNNVFGLVKFYKAAREKGIKAILGADLWIENEANRDQPYRVLALCQNDKGYLALSEILSRAYLENQYRGRVEVKKSWLLEKNEGLIILSGASMGDVGQAILQENTDIAMNAMKEWATHFKNRFYIEIQRIAEGDDKKNEARFINQSLSLATSLEIPVVATHPIQFMDQDDYRAHEARTCIAEGFIMADSRRPKLFSHEQYFKNEVEMTALFSDIPEALQNSVEIARRCNFEFTLGKNYLPDFPTPNKEKLEDFLISESKKGLEVRLKELFPDEVKRNEVRHDYDARILFETSIINQMGFAGYFLIVADFINWAKNNEVPVGPGRGSGAGSLVAYSLGVTDLDPIRYQLLFERFLNPDRVSMPDFDIDFCQEGRDRVIDYVKQKYGAGSVSQIVTFGTMAARAVIRDVGRVLDLPFNFVDGIAKLIPMELGITLEDALNKEPQLQDRYNKEEEVKELIDLALRLEGVVRNVGMHAGGVLIAPGKISNFTPIYCQANGDSLVSQFDKDDIEALGLVKFDFLGLRTLTILAMALKNANILRGAENLPPLDLNHLPLEDKTVFQLLKSANTTAVFQLESRGMKDMLKQAKPDCFEDIVALVALYRPGPMDLIPDFCKRKHGQQRIVYPHPSTESILKETYGIAVYQEQVMQIAQAVAGYSLGAADLLRRAMGKKKQEEMDAQREGFIAGSLKNGLNERQARELFDLLEKFAGYGFNKSHAAAYAMVAYQTAYLKTHYPAAFLAASMSADMNNTDNIQIFFEDCKPNSVELLPPDINQSGFEFIPTNTTQILYGLGAIKGTGLAAIELILESRESKGPFKNLFDFCARLDLRKVNRRVVESLIRGGAFDTLESNRASLLASVNLAITAAEQGKANIAQNSLFGEEQTQKVDMVHMDPWTPQQKLQEEKAALGFYFSGHPFTLFEKRVRPFIKTQIKELKPQEQPYLIAGVIVAIRIRMTARGKMAIVTLDDAISRVDVVVGNDLLTQSQRLVQEDQLLIVEGRVSHDDFTGGIRVTARKLFDLATARNQFAHHLKISCNGQSDAAKLRDILKPYCGVSQNNLKRCRVKIDYHNEKGHVELLLGHDWQVDLHDELIDGLTQWLSEENVKILYN
ncbi:DNA polymerase III subunit alpha [Candidatus Methylopumilus universalis]|uniref:DNA polymerase III subunit alpha n=1 Tax=Candidatus Methylopumilus universalis TaxID=2588536 RepID=UPI0011211092|nr:DNA polymerase III subunit alpha [Candidatus Methylopumilus universalis]QDC47573.1 DNA polymerase III subunit alpha [Candidatus Methylopumilus universalis]QDC72098.1 DNA polymerase III subunit alpha [Candidatus Methylopumilus universalis]